MMRLSTVVELLTSKKVGSLMLTHHEAKHKSNGCLDPHQPPSDHFCGKLLPARAGTVFRRFCSTLSEIGRSLANSLLVPRSCINHRSDC